MKSFATKLSRKPKVTINVIVLNDFIHATKVEWFNYSALLKNEDIWSLIELPKLTLKTRRVSIEDSS